MALKQTNKQRSAIGDIVQRQQGAATSNTGGGAGNTNNSGNTGAQDARTVSPDVQASRNARVGEYVKQLNSTSPITAVKTTPSLLSQGLETVNKLGVAAIPMEAARQVMTDPKVVAQTNSVLANARSKYGSESGGFLGIGSTKSPSLVPVVDAAELQRKALGTGQTVSSPSSFNLPDVDKEVSSAKLETPQSSLGDRFNENVKTYGSAESKSSSYYTPSGEQKQSLGGVQYTRDSSGNILRKDNSGNVSTLENRISSIGPNGTNVDGSPLSAKDQKALDNSRQMVSDWQDYKRQKEAQGLRNFIQANLGNQYITSSQRQEATDRLNAIEKGDIDKQQIASQEGIQARTLGATVRKNAFEEAKGSAELGLKQSENLLKAREQVFKEGSEAQKAWAESSKNMDSPLTQIAKYQSLGQTITPDIARAAYEGELSGIDNKEDYVKKLGELLKENKINRQVADMLVIDYDTPR